MKQVFQLVVGWFVLINGCLGARLFPKVALGAAAGVAFNPYLWHVRDTPENRRFWQDFISANHRNFLYDLRLVPDYALKEWENKAEDYSPNYSPFCDYFRPYMSETQRCQINRYNSQTKSFPLDEALKNREYHLALEMVRSGARSAKPIDDLLVDLVRNYKYPEIIGDWVPYYHEQHYLILALYRAAGRDKKVLEKLNKYAHQDNHRKLISILEEIDYLDRRWE